MTMNGEKMFFREHVRLAALTAIYALASFSARAHPHALAETGLTFVFDGDGLEEIRTEWQHDSAASMGLFSLHDKNEDGSLDEAEAAVMAADSPCRKVVPALWFWTVDCGWLRFNACRGNTRMRILARILCSPAAPPGV